MLPGSVDTYPQLLGSRISRITRVGKCHRIFHPAFSPLMQFSTGGAESEMVLAAKLRVFDCKSINNAKCQQNLILVLNDFVLLS